MTQPPATVGDFMKLLAEGDGSVQITDPPEPVRAAWRRYIHAVKHDGHVPSGSHLLHRGRNSGDLTIELRRGKHPSRRYRSASSPGTPVPTELRNPHPVIDALRNEPHRLPESSEHRSRSLMILQALVDTAIARGDLVRAGVDECLLLIVVQDQAYGVHIHEETSARWPTGRLVLHIDGPGAGTSRWPDFARRPLEQALSEVLGTIRRRAARAAAKHQAELREAERQRELKREHAITSYRDRILREQIEAWRLANHIRNHCNQMVEAGMSAESPWLTWARAYAESIDPLSDPAGLPDNPDFQDLGPDCAHDTRPVSPQSDLKPWHPNRRWYHR